MTTNFAQGVRSVSLDNTNNNQIRTTQIIFISKNRNYIFLRHSYMWLLYIEERVISSFQKQKKKEKTFEFDMFAHHTRFESWDSVLMLLMQHNVWSNIKVL